MNVFLNKLFVFSLEKQLFSISRGSLVEERTTDKKISGFRRTYILIVDHAADSY